MVDDDVAQAVLLPAMRPIERVTAYRRIYAGMLFCVKYR